MGKRPSGIRATNKGVSNRREVKNFGQAKSKPTWFCLRLTDCHIFIVVLREFLPNKNYKRLFSSLPAPYPYIYCACH